jgi:branched-chain amino acid transport system permease protein
MQAAGNSGLWPTLTRIGWALALVLAVVAPFVLKNYQLYQLTQVLIYAIALVGLNLLTGYSGQISLGHGAFFAIGGYGTAILSAKFGAPFWLALPISGAICFGAGFLFGFPALKLGGLYLALATFALAVAAPQILSYKGFDAWTGGAQGLQVAKLKPPAWAPMGADPWTYAIALVAAVLLFTFALNLIGGRIGRALIAIRDHSIAAEAMGVNAALYKTTAFGLSALYAGVAGGLSAYAIGFVSPESFTLPLSLAFLVGIVVGGLASVGGAIFGAFFIEYVPNYADQLTAQFGEGAKALPGAIYGVLLILIMAVAPSGVLGLLHALARRISPVKSA